MRNAGEWDGAWAGGGSGHGRIRYAFGGAAPRAGSRAGPWAAEPPAVAPHADLWVLVCGGIAAAAALVAAFVASGGAAVHAATPSPAHAVTAPAVTAHPVAGQACPSAAAGG
jgi:hypothetical protein